METSVPAWPSSSRPCATVSRTPTTSKTKSSFSPGPRASRRSAGPPRLALVEVDRADLRRAGEPCALDDRETDGAAADHGHAGAPGQTAPSRATEPTPVATAQPIRHACSAGSPSGTGWPRPRGRRCGSRTCPSLQRLRKQRPSASRSRPRAPGGVRSGAGRPRAHQRQRTARRAPAEDDAVARRERLDAVADGLDDARALVAEEDREAGAPSRSRRRADRCGRPRSPRSGRAPRPRPADRPRSPRARSARPRSGRRRDP